MANRGEQGPPEGGRSERLRLHHLLAAERARRGWTTYDAAEYFGVNQSSYFRWEQPADEGGNLPGKANLVKVADFLGIGLDEAYQLKYAVEAPVTLTEVNRRQVSMENDLDEMRAEITDARKKLRVLEELVTNLIGRMGPPEFHSEAGGTDPGDN